MDTVSPDAGTQRSAEGRQLSATGPSGLTGRRDALLRLTAVLALAALVACGGSSSLPTGTPASDPNQIQYEALVARWAAQKGLQPIPVSFMAHVGQAFGVGEVSGVVPCGERRIVFDADAIQQPTQPWFPEWITAHEVGHVFYREYERNDMNYCTWDERRADAFANELTGQSWWPHGGF